MKEKTIISGYLELSKPDLIYGVNSCFGNIVPFGSRNMFPQQIAEGLRKAKYQRGIIQDKRDHFVGSRFNSDDKKMIDFIRRCNNDYSFQEMYNRTMLDFLSSGNGYFQVLSDAKKSFLHFVHVDYTQCRINLNDEVVNNPDWKNRDDQKDVVLPKFPKFKKHKGYMRSMIHIKDYEPEFNFYGIPEWITSLVNMKIDYQTDEWNQHHVEHGFKTDSIFVFPDSVSDEDMKKIKENHKKFKEGKPGGFFYVIGDGAKIIPQNAKILDVDWEKLNRLNIDKTIVANSWYKSLMSVSQNTGFDTERVKFDYQLALRKILKTQNKYIEIFNSIFDFFGMAQDLSIINTSIIPSKSTEEKLIVMLPFFSEQQKSEIGNSYFETWKSEN